jgi:hypothetical protein
MVDSKNLYCKDNRRSHAAIRRMRWFLGLAVLVLAVMAWPLLGDLPAQENVKAPEKGPPVQEVRKAEPLPPQPPPPAPSVVPLPPAGSQPGSGFQPPPAVPPSGPGTPVLPTAEVPPAPPPAVDSLGTFRVLLKEQIRRFPLTIAANTSMKDLLPVAPRVRKPAGPQLTDDLAQVPEVEFQAPLPKSPQAGDLTERTAHTIARINHLNRKKTDGFLEALRGERPDLSGLPFAMGDACRTKGERSRQFTLAVATVRRCLQSISPASIPPSSGPPAPINGPAPVPVATTASVPVSPPSAEGFWEQYAAACVQEDRAQSRIDRTQREHVTLARIAALMQMLAPESPDLRLGLVKYLSAIAHAEATRALAKLSVFSAEDEVRQAALDALKVRRERDYNDVLLQGLRYPLPAVARRAGEAVVKLERTDLVPQLVGMLDEADPRSPVSREVDGKKVQVVREVVRVNHHRNCLMCHSPGNTEGISADTLTAPVPVPNQPLQPPSGGYGIATSPDVLVRIDVTYLRQDFSAMQPVSDAAPWPEMQRFDFLVRSRVLTEEEAEVYRTKLDKREPGRLTPYQRAAVTALRELTGKDAAPTAEAWRQLLELPARQRPTAVP